MLWSITKYWIILQNIILQNKDSIYRLYITLKIYCSNKKSVTRKELFTPRKQSLIRFREYSSIEPSISVFQSSSAKNRFGDRSAKLPRKFRSTSNFYPPRIFIPTKWYNGRNLLFVYLPFCREKKKEETAKTEEETEKKAREFERGESIESSMKLQRGL